MTRRAVVAAAVLLRAATSRACDGAPATPPAAAAPPAALEFTINTARRWPISPLIYGVNFASDSAAWGGTAPPAQVTFDRMGGNRLSAYNWETNVSNAGADYHFQNDRYLSASLRPGEAVRHRAAAAFGRGAAFLATVPMLPYVAGDACGCDVGTSDAGRAVRLAAHFRRNVPTAGSPAAGGPATRGAAPDTGDGVVAQDAFVRWMTGAFPGRVSDPARPLLFSLDNEPDGWHATHKEVQSDLGDDPDAPRLQTYDGYIDTTLAFARAVKDAAPGAVVFGPAVATYAGLTTLGRHPHPDPVYPDWRARPFVEVYLDRLRAAERATGRRLVDVLDVHWYPASGTRHGVVTNDYAPQDSADVEARVQAPRSLWDSTYEERTWVSEVAGGPVRLLPRLRAQVAAHYPGTRLAVTEYYFGRAGDVSGGLAQADALGIFGREGVYAAALWPQAAVWAPPYGGRGALAYAYAFGAFRMYLDYDGAGGRFGDTGVAAATNDPAASSVYASLDARGRVVVVAINKRRVARPVRVVLAHPAAIRSARAYTLTAASARPARGGDPAVGPGNVLVYTMPALSVSTLMLAP